MIRVPISNIIIIVTTILNLIFYFKSTAIGKSFDATNLLPFFFKIFVQGSYLSFYCFMKCARQKKIFTHKLINPFICYLDSLCSIVVVYLCFVEEFFELGIYFLLGSALEVLIFISMLENFLIIQGIFLFTHYLFAAGLFLFIPRKINIYYILVSLSNLSWVGIFIIIQKQKGIIKIEPANQSKPKVTNLFAKSDKTDSEILTSLPKIKNQHVLNEISNLSHSQMVPKLTKEFSFQQVAQEDELKLQQYNYNNKLSMIETSPKKFIDRRFIELDNQTKVELPKDYIKEISSWFSIPTLVIDVGLNKIVSSNKFVLEMNSNFDLKKNEINEIDKFRSFVFSSNDQKVTIQEILHNVTNETMTIQNFPVLLKDKKENNLNFWIQLFVLQESKFISIQIIKNIDGSSNRVLRNEVMNSFSHELRTPLNLIKSTLFWIKKTSTQFDEEFIKENINPSYEATKLINYMVESFIIYSSLLSREYKFKAKQVHLAKIVNKIINLFAYKTQAVKIINDIDMTFPNLCIETDERLLTHLFLEVIGNSIKFTQSGKIMVFAQSLNKNTIKISVSDTGVGMTVSELTKLENFLKNDYWHEKISNDSSGFGIGMSLIRNILLELNQDLQSPTGIKIYSEKNEGSKFEFYLNIKMSNHSDTFSTFDVKNNILNRRRSKHCRSVLNIETYNSRHNLDASPNENSSICSFRTKNLLETSLEIKLKKKSQDSENFSNISDAPSNIVIPAMIYNRKKNVFNHYQQSLFAESNSILTHEIQNNADFLSEYNKKDTSLQNTSGQIIPKEVCICKKILIVDDEETNRIVLKRFLKKNYYDFDYIEAVNGEEGLEVFKKFIQNKCCHNCSIFSSIFLDINMPKMNGVEVCNEIRKMEQDPNIPRQKIICYSAYDYQDKYQSDGFDYYLPKPCKLSSLEDLMKNII